MDMILKNTFQSISPAYELIGDVTVGGLSAYVDFDNLNIGKDDELLLVSDYKRGASGYGTLQVFCDQNGTLNTTDTSYWFQELSSSSTSNSAYRGNNSAISFTAVNGNTVLGIAKLKLTNSGHFVWQNSMVRDVASSAVILYDTFGTSTFTTNSITKLRFQVKNTSGIGAGSRFQLYKLVAEKVADIIVPSNTTSVDITGLNIGKDGEYYLVSDVVNPIQNTYWHLFVNANYTNSNYWRQKLLAENTTISAQRANQSDIADSFTTNTRMLVLCNIKILNSGYAIYQSSYNREYGSSGIRLGKNYVTSTFDASTISELRFSANQTNGIGANSRFTLYKMK